MLSPTQVIQVDHGESLGKALEEQRTLELQSGATLAILANVAEQCRVSVELQQGSVVADKARSNWKQLYSTVRRGNKTGLRASWQQNSKVGHADDQRCDSNEPEFIGDKTRSCVEHVFKLCV